MGKTEREKGKRFERQIANFFKDYGYKTRRGQQYTGIHGDADVIGLPYIHIECKAVERLNIEEAMQQSRRDAREGEKPVVIHKRNGKPVLVTMDLTDWVELFIEWEAGLSISERDEAALKEYKAMTDE